MNLANKYRPKSFDDVTEQGVTTEILTKLCQSEDLQLRNFLLIGPAGTGKAQPLYSKVLTPQGFVPMEYIAVGDEVITPSGRVARVQEVYPQGEREVYKIYTDDDSFFEVADNHLNLVRIEPEGCTMVNEIPEEVMETKELINIFNTQSVNVSIPCCQPYSFTYFPVPLSPYILGQELFHITFFGNEGNIVFNNLTPERFMMISDYLKDKNMPYCVEDGTIKLLQDVELVKQTAMMYIHNGVIAGQYTYNSPLIRKELLRGFLDGSSVDISRKQVGMTVSRATYRRLDWLLDIVRSLGLGLKVTSIGGGDDSQYVQITITFTREVNFFDSRSGEVLPCKCYRKITKIEKSGSTECKCILIDDPDHTYITDNYSVTHNTTSARIMAKMLNGDDGQIIEIDAASHSSVNDMRDIVEQAKTYPVGCKYKVILVDECHALSSAAWQSMLTCLESNPARTVFVLCLTGDGLVSTSSGLKRLDAIEIGDSVWDGEQFRTVNNVFDNGDRPCLTITLQDGSHIDCTDNHNLEVLEGDAIVWKEARNLKEGDCLLSYSNCPINSVSAVKLSSAECWMLGYITGNGNYTPHSLDIYTPYHKWGTVKTYLDELVAQHVFKDYIIDSDPKACDNNIHDTRIHFFSDKYHPGMTNWYERAGLNPNYTRGTKSLPQAIFSQSADNIRAFIDGWYFADGDGRCNSFFDNSNESPFLYCSNQSMILELQQLLKSIGEYCTVHVHETVITPEYYEKNSFIKPGSYTSYTLYRRFRPGYFDNESFRKILLDKYSTMPIGKYKLDLSNLKNPVQRISPKMITEAGYDYSSKGVFIPIKSIEPCGVKHVYDIEVEGSHKFVYNSFVVHNCTTNPEKIPQTILSRVQTFQLSKISLKGIQDRLIHILDCEIAEGRDITYDKEAVNYIAKLAQGGMRDAITLLDKALSYSNNINTANIEKSLNLPNYDDYFKLLTFIVKKDNTGIVTVINDVYDSGVNFVKWFDGFMAFISNIIKYIYIQDISQTMIPEHYQDRIASYGIAHAAICLKLSNKLVKLNQELRNTQYLQELAITYLCTTPNQTK